VEKILDLSALEANRHPLEMTELDVPSLVERALAPFGSSEQGGRLRASIAAQIAPAWGDEQAILGVLHQLIDNAFKYARKGDVCVAARQEGGHILLSVTDHGPGIPEGERERIFEMFHRLNLADSQEVYGHGLGLYMARRLVGAMGGEITVQEGPGNGACFVVRLPAVGAAEHAEGAA
jgi:signal transduction histidine kinase